MSPILVCMGNPLLDIQVTKGEDLLEKYELKANDAILAEEKHMPIYDDIVKRNPVYVAGGAAQNACRGAAYVLPEKSAAYIGAVGDDDLAQQLRAANDKEGVQSAYQVFKGQKTGACAVVITGHDRSLTTTLQAAESFTPEHLATPEVEALIEDAKFFYLGGFFLTHGIESALVLAKKSASAGKCFAMNLSAPFIPQFFKAQVDQMIPFCDVVIGNESEAEAYAESHGLSSKEPAFVATAIANAPKQNASRPRLVIITQGASSTIVASSDPSVAATNLSAGDANPKTYPVNKLSDDQIVDTNGAGDAFAGGFLGALASGKNLDECVEAGHKLGQICVGQVGPQFKFPKVQIL
ncbi:adenosine kinase [Phaffia rhodozyma]|uniref:Adenosine kinase n=1 Tax=Phaffia rhodozyma TaxID=264483 RepID=A0A0F7SSE1_PHARH|nr:adenosine kinase [Phaffia rhodozyma]